MQVSDPVVYIENLRKHYEDYFGVTGKSLKLDIGPRKKLYDGFYVLELPPNERHQFFCYCTVGMSADRTDNHKIELVVYAPVPDMALVELLTFCASYHRNVLPLDLHHTVNIGQPWMGNSACDHAFISLPYMDGEVLELFSFAENEISCYWLVPITEKERDYKIENGAEALEQIFEEKQVQWLNPDRECLLAGQ